MGHRFVRSAIDQLIRVSDIVETASAISVCRDPADDRVLECATAGAVELIVTGDEDLLVLGEYEGIHIVRVSEIR